MAGILQFWNHTATAMCQINNASVWTPLNYHSSGVGWPEFCNFEPTQQQQLAKLAMPQCLNPIELSLQLAVVAGILQFWTHTATAMCKITNASVWTPLNYHSSGPWWPEFCNFELIRHVSTEAQKYLRSIKSTSIGFFLVLLPLPRGLEFRGYPPYKLSRTS